MLPWFTLKRCHSVTIALREHSRLRKYALKRASPWARPFVLIFMHACTTICTRIVVVWHYGGW